MPSSPEEQAQIQAVYQQLMRSSSQAGGPPPTPPPAAPAPAAPAAPAAPQVNADALRSTTESAKEAREEADAAIAAYYQDGEADAQAPAESDDAAAAGTPPSPAAAAPPSAELDPIEQYLESARANRAPLHDASSRAERIIADANAEAARIKEEARNAAREEVRGLFGLMQSNPMLAGEKLQLPVADILKTAADATDPTAVMNQRWMAELQKRDAIIDKLVARENQRDEQVRTSEARSREENMRSSQVKFLEQATEDKYPALATYWGPRRLLAEALEESRAIHEAAAAVGSRPQFSDAQLLGRLEKRASEELLAQAEKIVALAQKAKGGKADKAPAAAAPAKRPPPKAIVPGATPAVTPRAAVTVVAAPVSRARESDREQQKRIAKMLDQMKGKKSA